MTVMEPSDSVVEMTIDKRAKAIRARREHLGMTKAGLAKRAGVDRGKLQRFEDGEDQPTDRWIGGIERALDLFEAETGHERGEGAQVDPALAEPIRFTFHDVYGIGELIVEGPVDHPDELVAAVAKLLAEIRPSRG